MLRFKEKNVLLLDKVKEIENVFYIALFRELTIFFMHFVHLFLTKLQDAAFNLNQLLFSLEF